ncbi:hypothetical protein EXM65_17825 [Clostridium botulinum]|uniref:Uncharacterized protein n=1 Tax=Clostridium botulinum TaxID=1491 RepID=A0A6M0SXB2_CLOBO|nr:hypothetical protein [Clostridium botulinum]NFA44366.1 hypothetical protein [Clostridium botulinum]
MGTPNTNFERRVEKALIQSAKANKRSLPAEINERVANALKIQTNEDILRTVKDKFNLFLKQNNKTNATLNEYSSNDCKMNLRSSNFPFNITTPKDGMIKVNLNDNVATVYFRCESKDSQLRDKLKELLKNNHNEWIQLHIGAKHTAIGMNTKIHEEIDQMTSKLIENILVDLFNLIKNYI